MSTIKVKSYPSPCGELLLGSWGSQLCLCDWTMGKHRQRTDLNLKKLLNAGYEAGASEVIEKTVLQLDEYFAGTRTDFDIPLLHVGTAFQRNVWAELLKIAYGQTISYGGLACRIGKPKAVRAVANANGANPISIIVPCHRVIGSDNSLIGYGGGLDKKQFLINWEKSTKNHSGI